MIFGKIVRATLRPVNIAMVLVAVIAFVLTDNIIVLASGLAIVAAIIGFKVLGKGFDSFLLQEERLSELKRLSRECDKISENMKNSTNFEKRYRVREMLKDKDEILDIFNRDKESSLKYTVAKNALELVKVNLQLIENYYSRIREIDNEKIKEVDDRIKQNEDRIITASQGEVSEIQEILELDRKLFARLTGEKQDIAKISDKMDYIQSSIDLFKQHMVSDIASEDILNGIEDIVNQAVALDNVLGAKARQKNKI